MASAAEVSRTVSLARAAAFSPPVRVTYDGLDNATLTIPIDFTFAVIIAGGDTTNVGDDIGVFINSRARSMPRRVYRKPVRWFFSDWLAR